MGGLVPGVLPVVLAWQVGLGTGAISLPPECGGSTVGACHGIGWGIAAAGLLAGVVLAALAWLLLPVGMALLGRDRDGPSLSAAGWVVALVPYLAAVVGLATLAGATGKRDDDPRWWVGIGTAVGAYLLVAAGAFVVALALAAEAFALPLALAAG